MSETKPEPPVLADTTEVVDRVDESPGEIEGIQGWWARYSSGPIPSAEELGAYNRIEPGLLDRIMRMSESEGEHRRKLETLSLEEAVKATRRGQLLSTLIALASLGAGVAMVAFGADPIAIVLILGAVGTLITLILTGGKSSGDQDEKEPPPAAS